MYDAATFSKEVISRWGDLIPDLCYDAGLLHCQMMYLAAALRQPSFPREEILMFLEGLLARPDADSEIENAIAISFLELPQARELGLALPPRIEQVLVEQAARDARAT